MNAKLPVYITVILVITLLTTFSCKKDNNESNPTPPSCNITFPENNQIIYLGETTTIEINANSLDGNIENVKLLLDDSLIRTLTIKPYSIYWNTSNEDTGNHTIEAICIDNYGIETSDKITIIIIDDTTHKILQSQFSVNTTCGTAPTTIYFTDRSTNNPSTWYWMFGDGNTSTIENPSHIYTTDGYYNITLIVGNETGSDTTTKSKLIYIGNIIDGTPCPESPTIMDIDSNIYNTVFIGGQCWMKENLRVGSLIKGKFNMSNNGEIERYCYNDKSTYCGVYGALYQWDEMMQYDKQSGVQGICPDGWHIPSDDDWKQLEMYLGMTYENLNNLGYRGVNEGYKLKSTTGWNNGGNGSNESNFSAIPAGYLYSNGSDFRYLFSDGSWWSSSEYDSERVLRRGLYSNSNMIRRNHHSKIDGLSVRCIKN